MRARRLLRGIAESTGRTELTVRTFAIHIQFLLLTSAALLHGEQAVDLAPRSPFTVPLARLSLGHDPSDGTIDRVRITYPGDRGQYMVSRGDDTYSVAGRSGAETHVYAEAAAVALLLSDFEAEQLDKVSKTLVRALEIFSGDLQRGAWDRCRYLDAFLPRFLNGFYHLYCVARNSPRALPRVADIPDRAYDVSLNSPISDQRIAGWMADPEYVVRLRIITRELIYQIRQWQKSELRNMKRNPDSAHATKFEQAYGFFVTMYFSLRPEPLLPREGEHL